LVDYTPYQQGIIKRYYEHKDTIALQGLAEAVSDLYLATSDSQKKRLWKRVTSALEKLDLPKSRTERILASRNLEALAKLLTDLS
jgi:hypothetical protein